MSFRTTSASSPSQAPRRGSSTTSAPWFDVPKDHIMCLEHPAKIVNVDRGMETIGGIEAVTKKFHGDGEINLKWRPEDITSPPVEGKQVATSNVLLKITVPKSSKAATSCSELMERLQASNGNYKIEPIANIRQTVRFRDMSDFQWNSSSTPLVENIRETLLPLNLDRIKQFTMSRETIATQETEFVRPPNFTSVVIPHVYGYNQNINMRTEVIDGETRLLNLRKPDNLAAPKAINYNCESVPQKPGKVPSDDGPGVKDCISRLRKLFEERPLWTRRALRNKLPQNLHNCLKPAIPHVAYFWKSGPWRDTCCKFGVDPRKSVGFAKYQVAAFKLDFDEIEKCPENEQSHIFDGTKVFRDGKVYQFCDVTDPLIANLISTEGIKMREEVDKQDGWYPKNQIFKIKLILREKIRALDAGKPVDNSKFESLINQPDNAESTLDAPEMALERQKQAEENDDEAEGEDYALAGGTAETRPTGAEDVEMQDKRSKETPMEAWNEELNLRNDGANNGEDLNMLDEDGDQSQEQDKVKRLVANFMNSNAKNASTHPNSAADEDFDLLGD